MSQLSVSRAFRLATAALLPALLAACSGLLPTPTEPPRLYALEQPSSAPAAMSSPLSAATLIINPPHAASGFNSQRIIYVRSAHQLEYYAHSEWVDTPARMLAPLLVAAAENSGRFGAVVLTPSAAAGDLRLDSEIIRLQHDLSSQPGQVRFTLRTYLIDNTTRRVLAWREFDETVTAASETPQGGVMAANQAVHKVLETLTTFLQKSPEIPR